MQNPSEKLHPGRQEDEQDMEMEPVVFGPPAFGSPDPATSATALVPVSEHPGNLGPNFAKDLQAGEEAAEGDDRPAQSATRAEWDEYARSQGVDPEEYSSKEDLIAALS